MAHRDRSRSPIQIRAPCDRRVYVANIPFDMKWTELKDLFKRECGENSVSFVRFFEDSDGKFRGCGIVEFKDSEGARKALEKLHRYELNGRLLVVKEDFDVERDSTGRVITRNNSGRDRDRSPPRRERSPVSHSDYRPMSMNLNTNYNTYGLSPKFLDSLGIDLPLTNKLFIANLDYKVTESDLKRLFKLCGRVIDVELYVDKEGNSKGNATVEFEHPIEAVQAISMLNRQHYHGRLLAIRMDKKENDDFKLPPGLEGIGKGLGSGGVPLRIPREFSSLNSSAQSNVAPTPTQSVAPVVPNPVAGLLSGDPSAAAGLAALTTALGAIASQTGANLLGGNSVNQMRQQSLQQPQQQNKFGLRDDSNGGMSSMSNSAYDDRNWRSNWN